MQVLVAGASGFLGQRVVAALHARGVPVIAAMRRPGHVPEGVEARIFDATDAAATKAAFAGVTHVVNCVMGRGAAMVEASRNLAAAAATQHAGRFVQLSSIAVYGNALGTLTEDAPTGQGTDWYGEAKLASEAVVMGTPGLDWIILRPALIHGPGSALWTARIARLLQARRLGDLGASGDGVCNLILIDDVVTAITAATRNEDAGQQIFNLAMPNAPSWNRYLTDLAVAIGAVPVRRIPSWQLRLDSKLAAIPLRLVERTAGKLRIATPDPIAPGLARLFGRDVRYWSAKADRLIGSGYTPYASAIAAAAASVNQSR